MDALQAISPVDGRYGNKTQPLEKHWSERALFAYRLRAEGEYLIALADSGLARLRKLSAPEKEAVRKLYELSVEDAQIIKDIETKGYKDIPATNHDVKSVEYFMKDRLAGSSLGDVLEWIHFGLTSEDVNNIAYALMLKESAAEDLTPAINEIVKNLNGLAEKHKDLPILARTHGQPASPTTFGKEMKVFVSRLERQLSQLSGLKLQGKLSGATGNWNAHAAAYPQADWRAFSRKFIEGLGLEPNLTTTQIEPHDSYVEMFDILRRINTILIGLDQDIWRYISDGWLTQKPKEGEVGSSTMPHKVNPIDFENSEGNLGLANALFEFFARKLPVSRLQRDLSDSTVERNFGSAFAYSLIAYNSLLKGLGKISVNESRVREELEKHPEVIAEAIQTILRREGVEMPYEKLKELTRGREVSMEDFAKFIDGLDVKDAVKAELKQITPLNYIGLAGKS